jgi:type II secretory pathway component GspD/PulD (secretin)
MRACQILVVCLLVGATSDLLAGPSTAPVATETRVYDISDLARPRNNYPLQGGNRGQLTEPFAAGPAGMGGMGGGMMGAGPESPGSSAGDVADAMVHLIQETVDPQSWNDNGGNLGSLKQFSGQLIVTQTAENHARIAKLLSELRSPQGPSQMVCVRAYWLLLNSKDIESIFNAVKEKGGGTASMPVVPDAALDGEKLYCQGQTICFNGQTVHITSGRQWSVVSKLNPVVANNAVGYDPTISVANSGVSIQVTPQIVPQSESAILDLRSTVTETRGPNGPIEIPARTGASTTQPLFENVNNDTGRNARIDRLNVVNQELATTVRLPLGKKILLGGMTLEPASATDPGRQLYLVVELNAVK